MDFVYFDGTGLSAQSTLIAVARLPFTSPYQPLVDPLGNPITVQVMAAVPTQPLAETMPGNAGIVVVDVEEGPTHWLRGQGKSGKDSTGHYRIRTKIGMGWKAVFTVYAGGDAAPVLTRWIAQWLMHSIPTAYAVDAHGLRLESYLVTVLRQCGISPRISPLFDGITYSEPRPDEARPFGQPYRAVLRMHFNIESNYLTPISRVSGSISVTPTWPGISTTPPAGVPLLPITIPLPSSA